MSEPIIVLDRSEVRAGKLEELKVAARELAAFVDANEPRPISFNVYFDAGSRMTVLQIHPDSASMEHHMRLAASEFPAFADLLELRSMDVFGVPSGALLDLIDRKVKMLGTASAVVHDHHAGFFRQSNPRR